VTTCDLFLAFPISGIDLLGKDAETTLRAKPKELPHGTLRRNRIGDLRAKDPKRARMESLWVLDCSSIYTTLHVSCARLSTRLYAVQGSEHSCHPVVRPC